MITLNESMKACDWRCLPTRSIQILGGGGGGGGRGEQKNNKIIIMPLSISLITFQFLAVNLLAKEIHKLTRTAFTLCNNPCACYSQKPCLIFYSTSAILCNSRLYTHSISPSIHLQFWVLPQPLLLVPPLWAFRLLQL